MAGDDTPLNVGALEGDARFLLGQIAQVMRELPARMTRFEQQTLTQHVELKAGQDNLAREVRDSMRALEEKITAANEKVNKVDKDLSEKIDNVNTKANVASGGIGVLTSIVAGLGILFWGRPHV